MTCSMDWISGRDSGRQRRPLAHLRSAGSPSKCQSNTRPSGSAIWKDSAAPVWTNAAQFGLPVWQIFLIRTAGELNADFKTTRRSTDHFAMHQFTIARVRSGSTASVERSRHVGFTPDSGRMAATQRTDASGHKRKSASCSKALCRQLVEQRLRFFQVERIEPFGEPAVDWSEQVARLGLPALIAQ
jgi:hypothetical protein